MSERIDSKHIIVLKSFMTRLEMDYYDTDFTVTRIQSTRFQDAVIHMKILWILVRRDLFNYRSSTL